MDFSYPEMHLEIRKLTGTILSDFAKPERLKMLEKNGAYLDEEVWQQLISSGVHTASFPEQLGGMGMDFMASTLVAESLGEAGTMVPYIPCIVSTVLPLLAHTADPLVASLLEAVAGGEKCITTALIEPGNEHPFAPGMEAYDNNGSWHLSGSKHCVPYAQQSSHVLLFAKNGNTLWAGLIDPLSPGCMLTEQVTTTLEPQCHLAIEGGAAHMIAIGDVAETLLKKVVAMTTVSYCSMAVGVASKMTRIAADYTTERQQFGVPIATFQAVAHRLANAYIDTECLRIITQKAASDVTAGLFESESINMAKIWCGDVMHRVSQASQHVHGGTGIDRDYHLFRYCLWAKHLELALGNSRVHLAKLADNLAERYLENVNA
jgi:alkylation response protein AidB-like acyl-CoA dehydrogenase